MIKIKYIILILLILLTLYCSKEIEHYKSERRNSYEIKKVGTFCLNLAIDSIYFGSVKDIAIWNDQYFVSDRINKNIWVLNSEGKIIKIIGGRGKGPGEFSGAPFIVKKKNQIVFVDFLGKKISLYNRSLKLVKSIKYPPNVLIQPGKWVYSENYFIAWGLKPNAEENISNSKLIVYLDENLKFIDNILEPNKLLKKKSTFATYNPYVKITKGNKNSVFAIQGAELDKIYHINSKRLIIKVFGTLPKFYKIPPTIKTEKIISSLEATAKYISNITRISKLDYISSEKILLVNYVNYNENATYLRTNLAGQHFLQAYDEHYNCIFDGKIPGALLTTKDGDFLVLISEKNSNLKIVRYRLVKK